MEQEQRYLIKQKIDLKKRKETRLSRWLDDPLPFEIIYTNIGAQALH